MKTSLTALLGAALLSCILPASASTSAAAAAKATTPDVSFALIRTASVTTLEGFTYRGGSFLKPITVNHTAVLVRHPRGSFLFDSGLGRRIDSQYEADMPLWARPFFQYEKPVSPARDQIQHAGLAPVSRIILSHSHWDHASGLVDFPEAAVWTTAAERDYMKHASPPGNFPSQTGSSAIRWHEFAFTGPAWNGYAKSLDLFGDGSAVLVPLPGHTPGAVGLFVTVASGRSYFFCGDLVWRADALREGQPKWFISSLIVDDDREATLAGVQQLHDLMRKRPDLVVVPAHDAAVQDRLGYFPQWVH